MPYDALIALSFGCFHILLFFPAHFLGIFVAMVSAEEVGLPQAVQGHSETMGFCS